MFMLPPILNIKYFKIDVKHCSLFQIFEKMCGRDPCEQGPQSFCFQYQLQGEKLKSDVAPYEKKRSLESELLPRDATASTKEIRTTRKAKAVFWGHKGRTDDKAVHTWVAGYYNFLEPN